MARTLSDLGVRLGIIGNNTTQISFDDLNTELGVSSETTRDLGGFSIAGISSLFTLDTTPDEGSTVQFQMIPTDVAGSPGVNAWQASDLASTTSHFTWDATLGGTSFASADYIADCTFPNISANALCTISLTYNDNWNPSMTGNVQGEVQNTGTGTGGGNGGGGGPAGCFALGTEILMNDNNWKRIETLEINDVVKSVKIPTLPNGDDYGMYATWQGKQENIDNITTEPGVVVQTSIDYYYDHYKIKDADGNEILVTSEHPFLIKRYDGEKDPAGVDLSIFRFARVSELRASDKLVQSDGTLLTMHSIEVVVAEDEFVNVNIETNDSYIVKWGDTPFIVHNKGLD